MADGAMAAGAIVARCDVVLVGTANPENLGGVARLVDNFAVARWTLVAPRAAPDDPRALVTGRMARARRAEARVVATLGEAVGEDVLVVGFSARRGAARPTVTLRELLPLVAARAPSGSVALVFGPEDAGLAAADVDGCDLLATIDLPGPLASLNLTQAVAIALWELGRSQDATPAARAQATHAELDALVEHAARVVPALLADGDEGERRRVHLRRVLGAAALAPADVRALHGVCAQLLRTL